jgi:hypothetical protein
MALKLPDREGDVGRYQSKEVFLSFALYGDMDVEMSLREIWTRTARSTGKVRTL